MRASVGPSVAGRKGRQCFERPICFHLGSVGSSMRLVVVQAEDECDKSVRDAISMASSSGLLIFSRNASMISKLPKVDTGCCKCVGG